MGIANMKPTSRKTHCESINPQIISYDEPKVWIKNQFKKTNYIFSPLHLIGFNHDEQEKSPFLHFSTETGIFNVNFPV